MARHLKGRHLQVYRGAFFHHGIGVGRGKVVHFSGGGDKGDKGANNRIIKTTLAEFQGASPSVDVVPTATTSSRDEIVARALAAIGSTGRGGAYSLTFNNCEHFARYCMTGRHPGTYDGQVGEAMVALGCGWPIFPLMYLAAKAGAAYCKQNGKTDLMPDLAKFESAFGQFLRATPAYAQLARHAAGPSRSQLPVVTTATAVS